MSEHETNPAAEWAALEASGELDKIRNWMLQQTPLWIKRGSGAWQISTIGFINVDKFEVRVEWPHPDKPGQTQSKPVYPGELLAWQKEHGSAE